MTTVTHTPEGPLTRARWVVEDTLTITSRGLAHRTRQPFVVIVDTLFPVMTLLLFGYVFGGGMGVPEGGDYKDTLVPGMLAMTMLFGIESTMTAVAADAAKGVTDRFRSMPMAQSAVVLGRSTIDMLHSVIVLVPLVLCGLLIGWRFNEGVLPALAAAGLLLWFRFAMLWTGIYLGLAASGPQALVSVQILVWPLAFLSNVIAGPETMPAWLGAVADWNPLSATTAAARELFGNPGWGGDSWAARHPVLLAVLWPALITAVFMPLSIRRYRRARG